MMVIDLNPFAVVIGAFLVVVLIALLLARRQAQRNPVASRPPLPAYMLSFLSNFDKLEENKPELTDVYVKLEDVRRIAGPGVDWEDVMPISVRRPSASCSSDRAPAASLYPPTSSSSHSLSSAVPFLSSTARNTFSSPSPNSPSFTNQNTDAIRELEVTVVVAMPQSHSRGSSPPGPILRNSLEKGRTDEDLRLDHAGFISGPEVLGAQGLEYALGIARVCVRGLDLVEDTTGPGVRSQRENNQYQTFQITGLRSQ